MYLQCNKCDWEGQPNLEWSGDHIKAICPQCQKYLKFVAHDSLDHGDMKILEDWQRSQVEEDESTICPWCGQRAETLEK